MASYPTFDPNTWPAASGDLANRAFDEVYEPGSTGKVITVAAALEEGVATPDTPVTVPNTLKRAGTVFHDSHDHPTERLTFARVLAQSSNIGTMLVGEKLSPDTMYSYLRKFGLGEKSGIGFPGETRGLGREAVRLERVPALHDDVRPGPLAQRDPGRGRVPDRSPTTASACRPRWSPAARTPTGPRRRPAAPRACGWSRPEIAKQVREMLEGVVGEDGTAPEAKIPGYRVAGKTGTADRYDDEIGGYSRQDRLVHRLRARRRAASSSSAVTLQRPVKGYFGGVARRPGVQATS